MTRHVQPLTYEEAVALVDKHREPWARAHLAAVEARGKCTALAPPCSLCYWRGVVIDKLTGKYGYDIMINLMHAWGLLPKEEK